MKILLVNGSPNKNGCTNMALTEMAKTLNEEGLETEIFWIGNKPVGGCIGCRSCAKTGKCIFDDVVNVFIEKIGEADGFVFGTPVHYAAASGNMTAFMDRVFFTQINGCENRDFYLKPAACVVSARRAGTTATYDQMNKYFGIQEMPIITGKYWNMVHGFTPEDVLQDEEGLYNLRAVARNMAFYLKCKEAGLEKGIKLPEQEKPVFTNFIR